MPLFLSSYENRLDTKGRISVPAAFRATIADENFQGVILYRSFTDNCIAGLPISRMDKMAAATDRANVFDETMGDLTAMLFADARQLAFDSTGRIIIPADLLKHAGITDTALFVGRGNEFQIWNPTEFIKTQNAAMHRLRALRPDLKIG